MSLAPTPDIQRALALAGRAGVDARVVRVERRGERVLVELPGHVVWLASDAAAVTRLAIERRVSQLRWGLSEPGEHGRRTGRTLDGTRAWAEHTVDDAS